ncbi:hypothetical protein MMC25_002281 [Agyrium rufum]|nr:hypothetical protein [Agyrium rufum]
MSSTEADLAEAHYDVLIVGAGVHGLCCAHTFLKINPSLSLLVLESKPDIGGAWAKHQLYPGLRANNLQGYYEFSDFPMLDPALKDLGIKSRGVLTGEAIYEYICRYAERFDLVKRVQLNTKVVRAVNDERHEKSTWRVQTTSTGGEKKERSGFITCEKLIVATGQASQPFTPSITGMDEFRRPIMHSAQLGTQGQSLLADPALKHVTVLGGSKSAHDAVYMFATGGKRVTWLTRRTGRGTMPMAKAYTQMGPWSVWLEGLLMTRSLSWFGACPWSEGDGFGYIRWLLHNTAAGRSLVKGYFTNMSSESMAQSGILQDEKSRALVPDQTLMWYGTQASLLNYDVDIYDLVRNGTVETIREDIDRLDSDGIVLVNGAKVETDALICATGYKLGPSISLEPADRLLAWGVPVSPSQDNLFPILDAKADTELFARFPLLASSPPSREREPGLTPWRLWRFIAPPSQVSSSCPGNRSLAFLSTVTAYQTTIKCELTSLWTYAYLFDSLAVDKDARKKKNKAQGLTQSEVTYEAALWSRFGKWSCPMGMQGKIADFMHDSVPYYDLLIRDLGLRSWRKGWGIFGEVFGSWYEVGDYRGLVDEWIQKQREWH